MHMAQIMYGEPVAVQIEQNVCEDVEDFAEKHNAASQHYAGKKWNRARHGAACPPLRCEIE
jgi:hypothetical protein